MPDGQTRTLRRDRRRRGVTRRRIAVVGSGVSGITAAYLLARGNDVTLYEADRRLGGHAHTHVVPRADASPLTLDTGFLVCNERTYPLFTRLLAELGVTTRESEMSMSVRCAGCGLRYAGKRGPAGLLAGFRHGGVRYAGLLAQVLRFHAAARALLDGDESAGQPTLGDFLRNGRFSPYFVTHFALPFVAAVWSCEPGTAMDYPARYLFAFLRNHGLLSVAGSPQWRTVAGGSARYVERAARQLAAVRAGVPVAAVHRFPGGAEVKDASGTAGSFDAVVIATHPDQALRLLADPTDAEAAVLGAFRYSASSVLLHTDPGALPPGRHVRASWNYRLPACDAAGSGVQISYYLNRLQRLDAAGDYVVTLNGDGLVRPELVLAAMRYEHPIYDPASVAAQQRLPELNDGVTAYAGAYHGWGFHEDGCRSGVVAAASLGARW
jgi:uncharacterized protein